MNKAERREAIRERCRAAIRDLYHNATPVNDLGAFQLIPQSAARDAIVVLCILCILFSIGPTQ